MNDNFSFRSSFRGFNRNDVMNYIAGLMEDVSSHENRIAELQKKLTEKETAFNELSDRYYQLKTEDADRREKKEAASRKCDDCDINRQTEARLGAAMMDAKRFSDLLVQEANDKALDIYRNAFTSVGASKEDAQALVEQIKTLSETFTGAFSELQDKMLALVADMDQFNKSIEDKGAKFENKSDFNNNVVEYRQRNSQDNSGFFTDPHHKNNGDY